jgi:hypothetical protein
MTSTAQFRILDDASVAPKSRSNGSNRNLDVSHKIKTNRCNRFWDVSPKIYQNTIKAAAQNRDPKTFTGGTPVSRALGVSPKILAVGFSGFQEIKIA